MRQRFRDKERERGRVKEAKGRTEERGGEVDVVRNREVRQARGRERGRVKEAEREREGARKRQEGREI